jgi:hypothetical protein
MTETTEAKLPTRCKSYLFTKRIATHERDYRDSEEQWSTLKPIVKKQIESGEIRIERGLGIKNYTRLCQWVGCPVVIKPKRAYGLRHVKMVEIDCKRCHGTGRRLVRRLVAD